MAPDGPRRAVLSLPLGRHVGVVLVVSAGVFAAASTLLWLALGSPGLSSGGRLTPADQLELVKLALAVVAGVGGVVALVVAYRRQKVVEEENDRARLAVDRERIRLFNERFVHPGTVPADLGKLYNELFKNRLVADYSSYRFTEAEVRPWLEQTPRFIAFVSAVMSFGGGMK